MPSLKFILSFHPSVTKTDVTVKQAVYIAGVWHQGTKRTWEHIPHAKRANVDALQQEKLRIYLLIPLIISKASFLLRVIVSCFQEDGLLDSVCLTSRCEARTLVAASSDGISH